MCLVTAWALVMAPVASWAKKGGGKDKELKKAIAAYNDLEYEKAVKLLNTALKKKLDRKGQLEAYRYLGLSYLALNKKDDARAAFRKILEVDASYNLPSIDSPVAIQLFEEEKKALAGGGKPDKPVEPPPDKPDKPVEPVGTTPPVATDTPSVASPKLEAAFEPSVPGAGETVTVNLTVLPADIAIEGVVLHHRVQGKSSGYSTVRAELQGGGRWTAVIPGAFIAAPGIEYYATAQDEDGSVRAAAGSEMSPLLIVVGAEEQPSGAPIYSRWWFWAGVGGVLVAGAAVGIVLATGGDDGGSGEDGFIDVTVLPPP